jgi:hypothetical protein
MHISIFSHRQRSQEARMKMGARHSSRQNKGACTATAISLGGHKNKKINQAAPLLSIQSAFQTAQELSLTLVLTPT